MGRLRRSLVQKLLRAADCDAFELPRAWHVFTRYRTAELFLQHPAPPAVRYRDDHLYARLRRRYPEVRLEPTRLNDASRPSLARRFVELQRPALAALERAARAEEAVAQQRPPGEVALSPRRRAELERAAFERAEQQLRQELALAGRETGAGGGYLEAIQQQEGGVLRAALRRLREQQLAAGGSGGGGGGGGVGGS